MSKVIVDDVLRAKLNNPGERVELCDENGRTLAHCLPDQEYQRLISDWLKAQVSEEELDQLRQQSDGRSLAEIWARLGQS